MDPFGDIFKPFGEPSDSDDDLFLTVMHALLLDEEDSDEEFLRTRAARLNRDREEAHQRLVHHYFAPDCVYTADDFDRRFRMPIHLFLRIAKALENRYF